MFHFKRLGLLDFRRAYACKRSFCTTIEWKPLFCEYFNWNFLHHEVSGNGEIRNRASKKILKGYKVKFKSVTIPNEEGKSVTLYRHRVVCTLFHGDPPDPKSVVIFLNENTDDVSKENLRWGSRSENMQSHYRKHPRVSLLSPVIAMKDGKSKQFQSMKLASEATSVHYQSILRSIKLGLSFEGWKFQRPDMQEIQDLPGEQWRTWSVMPDLHVSNLGRVKNIRMNRLLDGPFQIRKLANFRPSVARMVAECWVPKNNDDLPVHFVNHIDGNKRNNRADNLQWVSSLTRKIKPLGHNSVYATKSL